MDDFEDFKTSIKVMTEMGMDEATQESIFSILAGILHLGNVVFQETKSAHGTCHLHCFIPHFSKNNSVKRDAMITPEVLANSQRGPAASILPNTANEVA